MCRTTGGTAEGDLCKFPFEYGGENLSFTYKRFIVGKTYNECAAWGWKSWCYTEKGSWGYCPTSCPSYKKCLKYDKGSDWNGGRWATCSPKDAAIWNP